MFYVNVRAFVEKELNGKLHIVIQTRNKPGERCLELPGGRLNLFEPIIAGLKREVLEETGLRVTAVNGQDAHIDTSSINPDFAVECIAPLCVHQTTKGPIDSTGAYFRCKAEGELLTRGDETEHPRWISVDELAEMVHHDPRQFSKIDLAGIVFYLRTLGIGPEQRLPLVIEQTRN